MTLQVVGWAGAYLKNLKHQAMSRSARNTISLTEGNLSTTIERMFAEGVAPAMPRGGVLGGAEIVLVGPKGDLRRRQAAKLFEQWHEGVRDAPPRAAGGVSRHSASGRWQARVKIDGKVHFLGLFDDQERAQQVVAEFRGEHPAWRIRKLSTIHRNHARSYDEVTTLASRARILDVVTREAEHLVHVRTAGGRELDCSADCVIFTPEGGRKVGDLAEGEPLMVTGTAPRPSEALIPPSLRRGIGVWTSMQRNRLIMDEDACYLCLHSFVRQDLVLDHVVPVSADLLKALDSRNLAPACLACHRKKSDGEQSLARRGGKVAVMKADVILSICVGGPATTYGLVMESGNYVANGVVVQSMLP